MCVCVSSKLSPGNGTGGHKISWRHGPAQQLLRYDMSFCPAFNHAKYIECQEYPIIEYDFA